MARISFVDPTRKQFIIGAFNTSLMVGKRSLIQFITEEREEEERVVDGLMELGDGKSVTR